MKHTSINLSEEHLKKIAETGKSPAAIIREALDLYFKPRPELSDLIREHEHRCHMPDITHELRISKPESTGEQPREPEDMRDIAHDSRMDMPDIAHELRMKATPKDFMAYILAELEAGREPLLPDVVARFETTSQTLSKSLSPYGIRAQETKRGRHSWQILHPGHERAD